MWGVLWGVRGTVARPVGGGWRSGAASVKKLYYGIAVKFQDDITIISVAVLRSSII